jgi:hypothetical protein
MSRTHYSTLLYSFDTLDAEKLSISGLVPNGRVWIDTRNLQEGDVLLRRR